MPTSPAPERNPYEDKRVSCQVRQVERKNGYT